MGGPLGPTAVAAEAAPTSRSHKPLPKIALRAALLQLVFSSGPGMSFVVYLGEMLEVKVRIDLRR